MTEEITEDEKAFGPEVWVYCRQHLRPHITGWCTVNVDQKTLLDAHDLAGAYSECRGRGFVIYGDK